MSTTEPQREDEGVSAGRTSPAPLLVPARKPGSHRRGPPKGKTQATELKKPHEPLRIMRQMLKEMLQGGQEVDIEALWKAAFPEGWEAMPGKATGTGDWDQDMDYLEYRLEDGLKTSAHAGAEPVGDGQATSQPMSTTEPQREDEGVSAGRTSPAPLLVPARKPGSHRRGPPKRKNKATGDKKSLESNDVLKQILKEMVQGGQGGCISLSLLLSLSSRGLSLHICTRRARHRGRDPWQPRGPAAAFTPCRAVSQPGLAAAPPQPLQEGIWHQLTGCPNCTTGHAHPEIPCNFLVSG
ncbi:uncharacterized protein LOC116449621 [Corvus moneduloides]|uniref:uncharacterized protein LOC116449621 n=1 Tax=Corvus moneduloides TaxID=1196302 RepID=UPI001363FE8D|nr:uncharacterized protein LOC116449621 [Corvus moneduloides]